MLFTPASRSSVSSDSDAGMMSLRYEWHVLMGYVPLGQLKIQNPRAQEENQPQGERCASYASALNHEASGALPRLRVAGDTAPTSALQNRCPYGEGRKGSHNKNRP